MNKEEHWNNIYSTKSLNEVSWYQPIPETSLKLIKNAASTSNSKIIDIGGGDSMLIDNLLEIGFRDLSVLDISSNAIEKAKNRLGLKASTVNFIVSDIIEFETNNQFDVWHDRAVFHFLTEEDQIEKYKTLVRSAIKPKGHLIIGTFSENGPDKCSGINISKYSLEELAELFSDDFSLENSFQESHTTPFETEQEFSFVHLRRLVQIPKTVL